MKYQWYPGHMTKAMRMMRENLKIVDLIIELTDARIPLSALNPDLEELGKGKARLIVLNKADLADKKVNDLWRDFFRDKEVSTLLLNSKETDSAKRVKAAIDDCMQEKRNAALLKGIVSRPVRAMVVGIPNVGKSTLINSLTKRASAKTGNRPGVTKGKQWITLDASLQLLDTPGVLWPKFEDEKTGLHLALIGSMNDTNLDVQDLALQLIVKLLPYYREELACRYDIRAEQVSEDVVERLRDELLVPDNNVYEALPYLYAVAENRNLKKRGAEPDVSRAAVMILDDFRAGRIGRISLERP